MFRSIYIVHLPNILNTAVFDIAGRGGYRHCPWTSLYMTLRC